MQISIISLTSFIKQTNKQTRLNQINDTTFYFIIIFFLEIKYLFFNINDNIEIQYRGM